jgi:hypothetical protein
VHCGESFGTIGHVTERVKTATPVSEAGYVTGSLDVDGWTAWDPFEKTPELQWPASVAVYSRMDNEDSRVTSLLEALSLPIRSAEFRIDPNGAPDEVAEFVSRNLDVPVVGEDSVKGQPLRSRGRFTLGEHLDEVVSPTLQYGHSVFEQVYRPRALSPDGRFWIRKLAPRPQWTIAHWHVAKDGGLDSIEQLAPASSGRIVYGLSPAELPINRLVVYTRNKRPGQWWGKSILRSAYKHWLLKDKLLRIEAAVAERNGMGVPVGTASKPDDQDEVNHMAALARGFRGGMSAGVGLALGQALELLGVQGNLPDIRRAIDGHDRAIALSGLAHFLNLDGKGGSYALASVLQDPFVQAVQSYATTLVRIVNAHIIEDLVDINFGIDTNSPRLVFDPIGSRQDLTAAAIKLLADAGLFDDAVSVDEAVKRAIRQRFGLPSHIEPPDEPTEDEDEPAVTPAAPQTTAAKTRSRDARPKAKAPGQLELTLT